MIRSDHRPLKTIFNNSITKSPPRLQRFMLVLQKYDFEIEYIKGKDNIVYDTLSRTPLEHCSPQISLEDMNSHVNLVMSNLPISEVKLKEFMNETVKDDTLIGLKRQIETG